MKMGTDHRDFTFLGLRFIHVGMWLMLDWKHG